MSRYFCNVSHLTYSFSLSLYLSLWYAGMMIESMAGKSAALHGLSHDSTPFVFSEDTPAIDHFAKLLQKGNIAVCYSIIIILLYYYSWL